MHVKSLANRSLETRNSAYLSRFWVQSLETTSLSSSSSGCPWLSCEAWNQLTFPLQAEEEPFRSSEHLQTVLPELSAYHRLEPVQQR